MVFDTQTEILVLDVGGGHIAGASFHVSDMRLGAVAHESVAPHVQPDQFVHIVESLYRKMRPPGGGPSGVSVAMPNPFDYERGISYMKHKYESLYGFDLRMALAERLGCDASAIHFLNDAAAFLIGELSQGVAAGVRRAVGITLGTGIGSAFAVDGEIVVTGTGVPPLGEIWNLPYRDAMVEDFACGAAVQRLYEEIAGEWLQVKDIAGLADRKSEARQTFERFGTQLGAVLRDVCGEFAPQRIVVGGGVARSASLFLSSAQKVVDSLSIELRASMLLDQAPLIGAGVSWMKKNCAPSIQSVR